MALNSCLCGSSFGTKTSLRNHAVQHGHSLQCGCGDFFASKSLLKSHQKHPQGTCKSKTSKQLEIEYPHKHQNAQNRFWCGMCSSKFFRTASDRGKHLRTYHHACPTCFQVFTNFAARQAHQKSAVHCYCLECDEDGKAFPTLEVLAQHQCTGASVEKYECIVCEAEFSNAATFENHFISQDHDRAGNEKVKERRRAALTAFQHAHVEESNLWCEECNKHFVDITAYNQHKTSSKHKTPLVAITCGCGKEFSLVSALVQHLESGGCSSGMKRDRLNAAIYHYDPSRRITMAEHAAKFAGSSIAGSSTASIARDDVASTLGLSFRTLSLDSSRPSMVRDRIFTPDDSDATSTVSTQGGVLLTPDGSDHTSTDSESIMTPPASDTSSILSDDSVSFRAYARRGVRTSGSTRSFAASSDSESILTPTSSTLGDMIALFASTLTYDESNSDSESASEGVIFTPPGSSIDGVADEWSFVSSPPVFTPRPTSVDGSSVATIRYDTSSKSWPCSDCFSTFATKKDLRQHISSAVHAPKIFHCPTSGPAGTEAPDREFSTASGLIQHVEGGACSAGKEALKTVVGVMREPMRKKFKAEITSLE